jgi:hypothetical protein
MDKTIEDILNNYFQLYKIVIKRNEKLHDFISECVIEVLKIRPKWDKENDVRITIFYRINNSLLNSRLSIINLVSNSKILNTIPAEQINERLCEYDKFIRFSFFQNLISQIESGIRVIMRFINPTAYYSNQKPFQNIYQFIDDFLIIKKYDDILKMIRNLRNTIHNNGIFFPDNKIDREKIIYRGIKYLFENGKPVNCADWDTLTNLIEDMVIALKVILISPEIDKYENINDPIPKA